LIFDRRPSVCETTFDKFVELIPSGFGIGIRRNGRGGCFGAPRPPPRQCFRSPRINSANARFGLWDAWQAVLSALTWPNVEMRFEFHAERPRFYQYPTYKGFNHRQGEKTEEEFFTRHAHPRRRLGRSAADVLNRAGDRPQARPKRVRVALELLQLGGRRRPTPPPARQSTPICGRGPRD
jgi:hypothetical protein